MNKTRILISALLLLCITAGSAHAATIDLENPVPGQWSKEKINKWYAKQPWLVGCNYYPATAINQIEMWQASTWDPKRIDVELGWAAGMGMNTLRVYLHDLVWADDEQGLYQRMDEFLDICKQHNIRPWFVFFDDCHFPNPKLGEQPLPVRNYHNSGWMNCPARDVARRYAKGKATPDEIAQLKGYVQNTIARFKNDKRVLMWELYNEPGRGNGQNGDMASSNVKASIGDDSKQLVFDSWVWAREINPSQPITSTTAGALGATNIKINRLNSDLHSIHGYGPNKSIRGRIREYKKDGRPVIMTEWLARSRGGTVKVNLPMLKEENVGAINWGFVSGKSGTIWSWESRKAAGNKKRMLAKERKNGNVLKPYNLFPEPELWFHDLLRFDGTAYDNKEIALFRELTGTKAPSMLTKAKQKAYKKHNQAIHIKDGWIRDPYIYLDKDGTYYLTGTTPEPNSPLNWLEPYNTGLDAQNQKIYGTPSIVGHSIRVWKSTDLLEWKYIGKPFGLENGYWANQQPDKFKNTSVDEWRLWAPEIYHIDGKWAYVHTTPAPVKGGSNLAITTGNEMNGPFEFPMKDDAKFRHDPSLFKDDDGTWYLLWGNTMIAPIKSGFKGLAAKPVRIDPSDRKIGHEGATLRKIGNKYVHFGTAWSTDKMRKGSYNLYYCTSDNIMGPYGPRKFAGRFLGHGTPFRDKEGRWWCTAFFNGDVPPVNKKDIQQNNLGKTAQTINQQGTTIVPLEVEILEDGDIYIRAKDRHYAVPGPDEAEDYK